MTENKKKEKPKIYTGKMPVFYSEGIRMVGELGLQVEKDKIPVEDIYEKVYLDAEAKRCINMLGISFKDGRQNDWFKTRYLPLVIGGDAQKLFSGLKKDLSNLYTILEQLKNVSNEKVGSYGLERCVEEMGLKIEDSDKKNIEKALEKIKKDGKKANKKDLDAQKKIFEQSYLMNKAYNKINNIEEEDFENED